MPPLPGLTNLVCRQHPTAGSPWAIPLCGTARQGGLSGALYRYPSAYTPYPHPFSVTNPS
ncbi:MAG: hypothetical protein ACLQVM_25100 [Terriglobia bacterium]